MNEATSSTLPLERPRRLHLDWVIPALLQPRATFARIGAEARTTWLTPLMVLTLTGLLVVGVAGPIRVSAAQTGSVQLPPEAQYWTPEQQAAFMQAQAASSGPVFVYVFPALMSVLGVWVGWLIASGLLHLTSTLLGSRDTTAGALNLVGWAALAFAVRDVVRIAFMLATKQLIASPGLAGFAPAGTGLMNGFVAESLRQVDVYSLWYAALLVLGVRAASGLPRGKAVAGVVITLATALLLQVIPGLIMRQMGSLNIVRPFFF